MKYSSSIQENPLYFEINSPTFTVNEDDKAPLAANMVDSGERKLAHTTPPHSGGKDYEELNLNKM